MLVATTQNLEALIHSVEIAQRAPRTAHEYGKSLRVFLAWLGGEPLTRMTVQQYCRAMEEAKLAPATVKARLSAVKALVREAIQQGDLDQYQGAAILSVRSTATGAARLGNWLTVEECQQYLSKPDASTLVGVRDRAILTVLLGCALRRAELASLEVEQFVQAGGRWVLKDVTRKRGRFQTIPVPEWAVEPVSEWLRQSGLTTGPLFRGVIRGHVGKFGLTADRIYQIAKQYRVGGVQIAPHDLRRTCAKMTLDQGADLRSIQTMLGHGSLTTTERYLKPMQDLENPACDLLPKLI
jgi:site-specific recombinase XerD